MPSIPLSQPDITDRERKAVLEVLNTSVLSLGKKYQEFEKGMAKVAGVPYAVAVNSGTSALHLIIRALGIGKDDEVITTPFSFIASANAMLYEGAKPVFVDIDEKTFNINVSSIEKKITKKTKAILAPDIFSQPADWKELEALAKKHKLFLIEDSAEAIGSSYKGKACGGFGDAAIFSFYPNKQLTTGEGGVILTKSKKIYELCQSMANQGRKNRAGKWLEHVRLGYNYRLDEMSAALGVVQLQRIKEILAKRKKVALAYTKKLQEVPSVEAPYVKPGNGLSWFVYVVTLDKKFAGKKRDWVIAQMGKKGIACRDYFLPIHLQPFYKAEFGYKKGDFPVTEDISSRTIALPFYSNLSESQVEQVVRALKEIVAKA